MADTQNKAKLYEAYEAILKILNEVNNLNMDKKQSALQILSLLAEV